jgi:hypothetical protein
MRSLWLVLLLGFASCKSTPMETDGLGGRVLGVGGVSGTGGASGGIVKTFPTFPPCDIYAGDGGPCVAAHSTVRALYGAYSGSLYQVRRTDGTTRDIGVLAPGSYASSADQDEFWLS